MVVGWSRARRQTDEFLYFMNGEKKIGRPKGATQTERLQMRVPSDFFRRVDEWRAQQRPIPTRSEAIRRLTETALDLIEKYGDGSGK